MEPIALRTPSPGHTNSGSTSWEGSKWVSLTRRRIDSDTRSRRLRWTGKDMFPLCYVKPPGMLCNTPGRTTLDLVRYLQDESTCRQYAIEKWTYCPCFGKMYGS